MESNPNRNDPIDAVRPRRRMFLVLAGLGAAALIAIVVAWTGSASGPRGTKVIEYAMPVASDIPTALAVAADGSVWFSIDSADAMGVVRAGRIERIKKATQSIEPIGIAVDSTGRAWMTDAAAVAIVGVTLTGDAKTIHLGTPIARLGRMAAAPDDAIWFAESTSYAITRLKDGDLKRFPIDPVRGGPYGVAVAPDGAVWATLQSSNSLVRIAADGTMSEQPIPTPGVSPTDVAVDATGAVWFLEFRTDRIGRFQGGRFEEIALPQSKVGLTGLAVAPDGAVWFGLLRRGSIGRLRGGAFAEVRLPRERARPYSVAVDRAGNVWYADITGYIGMLPANEATR